MLEHDAVRSFIKVAECRSFSRAAKLLHKTTATISYRIKMLEESIGTQLFIRTTRSVSLTPAGCYLLERCRQWYNWVNIMPNELRQINAGIEHQVNIVINNLLYDADTVTNLLGYLKKCYPFTQFHISHQVYMGVWDALLNGDCQLAIGAAGNEALAISVDTLPLGKIEWVFVIAATHPLAKQAGPLLEEQLRVYPAINIEDTARHLTKRVAWLLPGQNEIKVPDLNTKLKCHLQGIGIGFLPQTLCQPYLERGDLVRKSLKYPRQPSSLSLAWSNTRSGEVVKTIIALFQRKDSLITGLLTRLE